MDQILGNVSMTVTDKDPRTTHEQGVKDLSGKTLREVYFLNHIARRTPAIRTPQSIRMGPQVFI